MGVIVYSCLILATLLSISEAQLEIRVDDKNGGGASVYLDGVEMIADPACNPNARTSAYAQEYQYQCQTHCLKLGHGTGQCMMNKSPPECQCSGQSDDSYKSQSYIDEWNELQECMEDEDEDI